MSAEAASLDVLATVGDAEPRVVSLAVGEPGEVSVTVVRNEHTCRFS